MFRSWRPRDGRRAQEELAGGVALAPELPAEGFHAEQHETGEKLGHRDDGCGPGQNGHVTIGQGIHEVRADDHEGQDDARQVDEDLQAEPALTPLGEVKQEVQEEILEV